MTKDELIKRAAGVVKYLETASADEAPRILKVLDEAYNHVDVVVAEYDVARKAAVAKAKAEKTAPAPVKAPAAPATNGNATNSKGKK